MCRTCIANLQQRMEEAALKVPPENLIVHIDNFDEGDSGMHADNAECWCKPMVVNVGDTRNATEVMAECIGRDVDETEN